MCAVALACGCTDLPGDIVYSCANNEPCPSGQFCGSDQLCHDSGGGGGGDGGGGGGTQCLQVCGTMCGSQSDSCGKPTDCGPCPPALGSRGNPGSSCKAVQAISNRDGAYWIQLPGELPSLLYCDMSVDQGGWTLVGMVSSESDMSGVWLRTDTNLGILNTPQIQFGPWASVNAVQFAVSGATEVRLANSSRTSWVKWTLPAARNPAQFWNHMAGESTIAVAPMNPVTVTSSKGTKSSCFQNDYGILPLPVHGGSYPSTAINQSGNTSGGDWCMSVGVETQNMNVDGFAQNGNGFDAPSNDGDWPNSAFNVPPFVSVWLR